MSERRLRVTVDESRHLFQNLLQEARSSYREVFPDAEGSDAAVSGGAGGAGDAGDSNWLAVDHEIRAVYEMSRFALRVAGLPGTEDLDDFRGFCEDVDGLEPLDKPLLNSVGRLCVQINDQLLANSEYRRKIPRVVANSFEAYVGKRRAHFDALAAQAQTQTLSASDAAAEPASSDMPPNTMLDVVSELAIRMQRVAELLESV